MPRVKALLDCVGLALCEKARKALSGHARFGDALPVALDLQRAHDREPLVAYWLATIYQGLGRSADARSAWDEFRRLTGSTGGANAD